MKKSDRALDYSVQTEKLCEGAKTDVMDWLQKNGIRIL